MSSNMSQDETSDMELEDRTKREAEPTDDALFDGIMKAVGTRGPFQLRFNIIFNFVFVVILALPDFNYIMAMAVPDHWCHVPGRNLTNMTAAEWKARTIPTKMNSQGVVEFESCKMYNISWSRNLSSAHVGDPLKFMETGEGDTGYQDCQHGWEYDDTWYSLTAPSQEDWVCDRELYAANTFAFCRLGEVIGILVIGQLGDILGRKPVFYISLLVIIVGRVMFAFTAGIYYLFLFVAFFSNTTTGPLYQSPLILGIEMTDAAQRSHIALLHNLGWTVGMCIMPLVLWASRNWVHFLLLTSLPSSLFFTTYWVFPESPRWLASKGKIKRCKRTLDQIAKKNGTTLPEDIMEILQRIANRKEKVYGAVSLFSSWRLAKNVLLISLCWVVGSLVYFTLMINVTNLSGNPFLNFFFQSLVELPGYVGGKYLSEKIGRRWTQTSALVLTTVAQIFVLFIVNAPHLQWVMNCLVVFVKLVVTASFYTSYLIAMETYPTCVRQTGISITGLAASGFGMLGPYIVYLGTAYDRRWPYVIMGSLTLLSAIASAFLPETLNEKLPETLEDAKFFGKDQKFWSWPPKTSKSAD